VVAAAFALVALAAGCGSASGSGEGGLIAFEVGRASGPAAKQGFDIYLVNADGSGLRRLTRTRTNANPAWSPDGRRIAFACANGNPAGHAGFDICVMNADGSGLRRLTHFARTGGSLDQPAWSPDGKLIAAVCAFDICLVHSDTGRVEPLTVTTGEPLFLSLIWSPDSRSIASSCLSTGSKAFPSCVVTVADGNVRRVTRSGGVEGWTTDGRIVLSTFAAFEKGASALTRFKLYTINTGGGGQRPLPTSGRIEGPRWSPDGKAVLVSRSNQLLIVGRDGKVIRTLVSLPSGSTPSIGAWQPLPATG
jgi:Tol biopolymer transport system component